MCEVEVVKTLIKHGAIYDYNELCDILVNNIKDNINSKTDPKDMQAFEFTFRLIAKLEILELENENNSRLINKFKSLSLFEEKESEYNKYLKKCRKEIARLKNDDKHLYDILREGDIDQQVAI